MGVVNRWEVLSVGAGGVTGRRLQEARHRREGAGGGNMFVDITGVCVQVGLRSQVRGEGYKCGYR